MLSYDSVGQIIAQISQHASQLERRQKYYYDNADRLKGWNDSLGTQGMPPALTDSATYTYDAVGNRQNRVRPGSPNTSYTYSGAAGGSNRLAGVSNTFIADLYTYNANGSTSKREKYVLGAGTPTLISTESFFNSYRELLWKYTKGNTVDWRYRYSASGEREQKRAYGLPSLTPPNPADLPWVYYQLGGSGDQLGVWHGVETTQPVCRQTGTNVMLYPVEYNSTGMGWNGVREVILPLTTKPTGVVDYHVSDNVASLRVSLNASGVQGIYDYDPWGNPLPLMGGAVTGVDRSTFNDQERDAETGLYDLSARKYDGEIGRFTSIDPLWEQERAQTPYNYCRNNPVRLTDPTGMQVGIEKIVTELMLGKYRTAAIALLSAADQAKAAAHAKAIAPPSTILVVKHTRTRPQVEAITIGGAAPVTPSNEGQTLRTEAQRSTVESALRDTPLDAYRHALACALASREHDPAIVVGFGDLHEAISNSDETEASCNMDRFNNRVGVSIGAAHPNATDAQIEQLVWNALVNGKLQWLHK